MQKNYNHIEVESKWRKEWDNNKLFQGQYFGEDKNLVTRENKLYVLPQLPYPSGSGLHMGHAEGYTACDIYARYKRMNGKKVMQVIGWDAFGLPAENYAIKTNIHPRINTDKAVDNFRAQIKALGISVDWEREVGSHNPDYYKFTQWFFLLMYKRGLAYRKKQSVNWCESCKTVLANEQVVEGKCERCSTEVIQKEMEQWFFKITDYAERLIKDLDKVDWPEESVKRQRDWIGKSEGAYIYFPAGNGEKIKVFTTRPDTIYGATYMVLSPEHPLVEKLTSPANKEKVAKYRKETAKKTALQREHLDKAKTGVFTGGYVTNPASGEEIPVWIADYVLMTYGTGAIMGVPAHDTRDYEFALKHDIKVIPVVAIEEKEYAQNKGKAQNQNHNKLKTSAKDKALSTDGIEAQIQNNALTSTDSNNLPYLGEGLLINSNDLNGLKTPDDMPKVIKWLESKGIGEYAVTYKLRDWSISRQRFWGAPIPMVYDTEGKIHPVSEEDLPVILPDDVDFVPTGRSPLTYSEEFQKGVEEKYGKGWRREVDTLDTFMCSSWYYFRYLDPKNDKEFASRDVLKRWMPVDFYIGGPEHVTGHLLYSRFFTKVLFDAGYIDFDEPFLFHRHQGLVLGEDNRKMSKRWGNVINPSDMVEKYGADTSRMYEMFMGPLTAEKAWNTNGVIGVNKFVGRIYKQAIKNIENAPEQSSKALLVVLHKLIKKVSEDTDKLKFNTAIAKMMEFVNAWERDEKGLSLPDMDKFVRVLAPYAPFVSEELFQTLLKKEKELGKAEVINNLSSINGDFMSVHLQSWPEYDSSLAKDETIDIAVQVNGKVRGVLNNLPEDITEEEVIIKAKSLVEKYLKDKNIEKTLYIPGKICSFVVKNS